MYKILYGTEPRNFSDSDGSNNFTDFQDFIQNKFGSLNQGALYRHETKNSLYSVPGVLGILSGTPVGGPEPDSDSSEDDSLSDGLAHSFEVRQFLVKNCVVPPGPL